MSRGAEVEALCASISAERQIRREARRQLAGETKAVLGDVALRRRERATVQAADLRGAREELHGGVLEALSRCSRERQEMARELRIGLREFRACGRRVTGELLSGWRQERAQQGQILAQTRSREASARKSDTAAFLRARAGERAAASLEFGGRLEQYRREVRDWCLRFLSECREDRLVALRAWASLRGEPAAVSSVPSAGAVEPAGSQPSLGDRVLGLVAAHPEGITLVDMEAVLGVARVRLGVVTRELVDAGLIAKEGRLYLPVEVQGVGRSQAEPAVSPEEPQA